MMDTIIIILLSVRCDASYIINSSERSDCKLSFRFKDAYSIHELLKALTSHSNLIIFRQIKDS